MFSLYKDVSSITITQFLVCLSASVLVAANDYHGNQVHIDDLLAPAMLLEDITSNSPDGVSFQYVNDGAYSLVGSMPEKRCSVVLKPESGSWDISGYSYLRVDLVNNGPGLVWVQGRLDNPDARDWVNSTPTMAFIMPGESATIGFAYPRAKGADDAPKIFDQLYSKPNWYRKHWKEFNPANVVSCRLLIQSTSDKLSLGSIKVSAAQPYGAQANRELLQLPYLDEYGQFRQLDWPGKLTSADELKTRHLQSIKELAKDSGPHTFNKYGGWQSGPQLNATGFFHTKKYEGKWWLVDPAGRLF